MGNLVLLAFLLVYYLCLVFVQLIFYIEFLFKFSLGGDFFSVGSVFLGNVRTLVAVELNVGVLRPRPVDIP